MLVRHSFVLWTPLDAQVEAEPAACRLEPAALLVAAAPAVFPVWVRPVSSLLWASAPLVAPGEPAVHMVVAAPAVLELASVVLTAFVPVACRPARGAFAEPEASGEREAYMTGR